MSLRSLAEHGSPRLAQGSVHVRRPRSLRGDMAMVVLAAAPCALAGAWNAGHQVHAAAARLGEDAATGWRFDALAGLGVSPDPGAVAACLLHGALYLIPLLAAAWLAGAFWEHVFARVRGKPRTDGLMAYTLLFVLLLPPATPWWQAALGMSFGLVFARELFGGTGMGFLCVPAAGAAFLALAWPGAMLDDALWQGLRGHAGTDLFGQVAGGGLDVLDRAGITRADAFLGQIPGTLGTTSVLACVLGGALLVARGIASWRVIAGVVSGALGMTVLLDTGGLGAGPMVELGWSWHLSLGAFAFGAVFLATDSASGPVTHGGRWILGLLVGSMIVLIRVANPLHPDGVVLAVLFGNVFAPLIDSAVVAWHVRRRRRRHA